MIQFKCPACRKSISAPEYAVGKNCKCKCGEVVRVPMPPAVAGLPSLRGQSATERKAAGSAFRDPQEIVSPVRTSNPTRSAERAIKCAIGAALMLVATALHFSTCSWESRDRLSQPPLIALRQHVTIDQQQAAMVKAISELNDEDRKEMESLSQHVDLLRSQGRDSRDAELTKLIGKLDAILDTLESRRGRLDDAFDRAFGVFGVYSRGSRDTGLIVGFLAAAIFLLSGLFLVVWGFGSARGIQAPAR